MSKVGSGAAGAADSSTHGSCVHCRQHVVNTAGAAEPAVGPTTSVVLVSSSTPYRCNFWPDRGQSLSQRAFHHAQPPLTDVKAMPHISLPLSTAIKLDVHAQHVCPALC